MKPTHVLSLVIPLLFLQSCATTIEPVLASRESSVRPKAAASVNAAAFQRGRMLAVTECATCHRFFKPSEFSPDRWPAIIHKMGRRSSLNPEQMNNVLFYYTSSSE